jgi:hypothetical protein
VDDSIVTFLNARLDEREARARAVEDNSAPWVGQWKADGNHALRTYNDWVLAYLPGARPFAPGVLAHIADNDPAYVLADVASKRQVVRLHSPCVDEPECHVCGPHGTSGACLTLCLLVLPYAGHAAYDERWKP